MTTQPKSDCLSRAELLRSGIDDKHSSHAGDRTKHHIAAMLKTNSLATGQQITGMVDNPPPESNNHCHHIAATKAIAVLRRRAATGRWHRRISIQRTHSTLLQNVSSEGQPVSATVIRRHRTRPTVETKKPEPKTVLPQPSTSVSPADNRPVSRATTNSSPSEDEPKKVVVQDGYHTTRKCLKKVGVGCSRVEFDKNGGKPPSPPKTTLRPPNCNRATLQRNDRSHSLKKQPNHGQESVNGG